MKDLSWKLMFITVTASTNFFVPGHSTVIYPSAISTSMAATPIRTLPSGSLVSRQALDSGDSAFSESWLKQHYQFIFVIFIALIFLGLLIWYIVRSVKSMRKRLAEENSAQVRLMQPLNSTVHEPDYVKHEGPHINDTKPQ